MASAVAVGLVSTTQRPQLRLTGAIVAAADMVTIAATIGAAVGLRHMFHGNFDLGLYARLWPLLAFFPLVYALFGLYPGVVLNPVAEIRKSVLATTLVFLMMGALTFVLRDPLAYSRLVFVCAWLASLPAVPLMRAWVRSVAAKQPWWGYRVVVIGDSVAARAVLRTLIRQPELGLLPVAVFDDGCSLGHTIEGLPVLGPIDMAARFAERAGINRAIVVVPEKALAQMQSLVDLHARTFSHVYILPGMEGLSSVGMEIKDLSRNLALEVRANLLMAGPRAAKRAVDLVLTVAMLVLLAPLFLLLAVLIKLDSRGPVLYRQGRIGRGQTRFRVWKFRSMCQNADQVLAEYLACNPSLELEWQREHKLRKDPRITRVGRFLRKTSLDELPQLWNVLRGEMSLVGPRPIVDSEVRKYGDSFALYLQVIPGLTGLWQVSGRNECTYRERVELDNYYVRNWSPWLDLYLLARTVRVVATGYGAY